MRRRIVEQGVRAKRIKSAEYMLGLARSVDAPHVAQRYGDRLADLRTHRPVILTGGEVGLPHLAGCQYLLEPDGTVVVVAVVTRPGRPVAGINYRRKDGTVVFEDEPT